MRRLVAIAAICWSTQAYADDGAVTGIVEDALMHPLEGATVVIHDPSGSTVAKTTTGKDGKYLFDDLPDGTYRVCFPVRDLPAPYTGYQLTRRDAAGHDGTDSAVDTASGCTGSVTLGPDNREDLTLDAGYVAPAKSTKPSWLASTGVAIGGFAAAALVLLLTGGLLLAGARRRRREN